MKTSILFGAIAALVCSCATLAAPTKKITSMHDLMDHIAAQSSSKKAGLAPAILNKEALESVQDVKIAAVKYDAKYDEAHYSFTNAKCLTEDTIRQELKATDYSVPPKGVVMDAPSDSSLVVDLHKKDSSILTFAYFFKNGPAPKCADSLVVQFRAR